ncbi:MAG: YfcE family phosphodiesterase [Verrucomicrobiales bacterium]|nr:YfcE family phosphodiesterase [Verrucomicrobiales bacterium]
MKVAVLSDIHDNLDHLAWALKWVQETKAERLFFLGDFCAPFSLDALGEGFEGSIDAVFGNNDGDQFLLSKVASKFDHVTLHAPLAELTVEGRKVALQHYPEIGKRLAQSGAYDAVFSGHDHLKYIHNFEDCLWANPGEIMGRLGAPSFGVWDTVDNSFSHIEWQINS